MEVHSFSGSFHTGSFANLTVTGSLNVGNITLFDGYFLKVANTGSLPTATGSYQGKIIIKTGSGTTVDQFVACLWTGSNWAWLALQTGSVVT